MALNELSTIGLVVQIVWWSLVAGLGAVIIIVTRTGWNILLDPPGPLRSEGQVNAC
jgi:hypothetical protein